MTKLKLMFWQKNNARTHTHTHANLSEIRNWGRNTFTDTGAVSLHFVFYF